ncbi:VOC family protein [bacterium]|nr:VOC family protein [bacterium]
MNIRRIVPDIVTDKMEASKKFYSDFFELKLAMDLGWVATLISTSNETAQVTLVKGVPPLSNDLTIALTIEVENVDAVYQKAKDAGLKIIYPMTDEPWGVRRFHISDPNGVVINVMTHLSK